MQTYHSSNILFCSKTHILALSYTRMSLTIKQLTVRYGLKKKQVKGIFSEISNFFKNCLPHNISIFQGKTTQEEVKENSGEILKSAFALKWIMKSSLHGMFRAQLYGSAVASVTDLTSLGKCSFVWVIIIIIILAGITA